MASEHPNKRARLDDKAHPDSGLVRVQRAAFLSSISRNVSPPAASKAPPQIDNAQAVQSTIGDESTYDAQHARAVSSASYTAANVLESRSPFPNEIANDGLATRTCVRPSPFSLTKIRDLPLINNIDSVSLHDILGNPLIKEVWIFNFCFDIDWMMQFFDSDVRDLVQVKIIHGSWRREDRNRTNIEDACGRRPNVEAFKAYLPDQFGTHHSKMFVLFTHDEMAEVVIHTANMLMKDWKNMTQAVWRTGPLPKTNTKDGEIGPIGSGTRFKDDLLAYLKEYKKPTQLLYKQLQEYDFSHVRGALIASVPSKFDNTFISSTNYQHLWGYPQLREVLSHVNRTTSPNHATTHPHLVAQVSSIATLPNTWLDNFVKSTNPLTPSKLTPPPSLSVIYPTPSNVAASLDGYAAGGSIHTKAQTTTHLAQIDNLRPHLHQWTRGPVDNYRAGRDKAAPHIKTYIQFNTKPTQEKLRRGEIEVEWALLTSANLSVQAWGSLPRAEGKGKGKNAGKGKGSEEGIVHIQSFEIGVLVWPELFDEEFGKSIDGVDGEAQDENENASGMKEGKRRVRMIPVFGKDTPEQDGIRDGGGGGGGGEENKDKETLTIGLRMPYDLPLTPYAPGELPWSPQGTYLTPDSRGGVWTG